MYIFFMVLVLSAVVNATPLNEAVMDNNHEEIIRLIENGEELNGCIGTSPLEMALLGGNIETVLLLLQRGADPNLMDISGGPGRTRVSHMLKNASTRQQIVALLSYGATPYDNNDGYLYGREYSDAAVEPRYLHLYIYHQWQFSPFLSLPRPENIDELNAVIRRLPRFTPEMSYSEMNETLDDYHQSLESMPHSIQTIIEICLSPHPEDIPPVRYNEIQFMNRHREVRFMRPCLETITEED